MEEESGRGRPKRQSSAKQKKLALLERMRETVKSGKKNKYDIGELDNVYDEVDEKEYTKKVLQRQDDDWIVDDGGCGYVEDGREIFDDDLDEESISKAKPVTTGKKRARDIGPESKGNIRSMLVNMPSKKKKENVKLDDDDILGTIIGELSESSGSKSNLKLDITQKAKTKETTAKDYIKSFATRVKPLPTISHTPAPKVENVLKVKAANQTKPEEKIEVIEKMDVVEEKVNVISEPALNDLDDDFFFDTMDEASLGTQSVPANAAPAPAPAKPEPVKESLKVKFEDNGEWNDVSENDTPQVKLDIDKSTLPLIKNEKGDEVFRFFFWDAHEELVSQPGTIFLFGKVYISSAKSYVSCCVSVKNVERQIYLLPREKRIDLNSGETLDTDVTMGDVYEEFNNSVSQKYKIKMFKSRKTTKKYAFGKDDIPIESEYLEVRYPAHSPSLPSDLKGETFSCIFGTKSSFLELFLLQRGIKGPCWLDISSAEAVPVPISWCKFEATCNKALLVNVAKNINEIPPIILAVLRPQMVYNQKTKQSEISAVGCLVNDSYYIDKPAPKKLFNQHFCILSRPTDCSWPFDLKSALAGFNKTNVTKLDSERALLSLLLTRLFQIDADIIIGHDISGYGIDVIVSRLSHHKVPHWSRLGRLKRSQFPSTKIKSIVERIAMTGRMLCDIKLSAKELIRSRSYDLDALCTNVLNFPEGKRPDTNDELFKLSYNSGPSLVNKIWELMCDASYILKIFIELNILPLALQITNIAGNVISRTLLGGRSERNEFLLLHAFYNKDFILPDKEYKKKEQQVDLDATSVNEVAKSSRKKPTYAGGLVLDPKVGFYDDFILLMDFNSLYPSIIQEYNICFTTIPIQDVDVDDDAFVDKFNKYLPSDDLQKGILPIEIRKLVESRKDVKRLLKSPNLSQELKMQYDIRQMALKLTANSMYGCLGFTHSRFYAKSLAALVTAKGREILLNTKKLVENYGYEVIYGDTDSIMINTKTKEYDQVNQVGKKLKTEVNKLYKQVELDIDGVFKYMLLLKKKKYAAVTISKSLDGKFIEKQEIKGLDIVRRDWSQLSAEAGKFVLRQILSAHSCDDRIENIHGYLENIRQDLQDGKVPLPLLTVTKQLTKQPESYSDSKSLPHVQVALRINKATGKKFKQGDTVPYIICQDGTNNPATQRAYHCDELKTNKKLSIDVEYYLSQQIHPVIARLCEPIEGTDAASIARCLGLDPSRYNRHNIENGEDGDNEGIFGKKDDERYKDCERFVFKCWNPECSRENIIESPLHKMDNGVEALSLARCVNNQCNSKPIEYINFLKNKLKLSIRHQINKFGKQFMTCDDPVCGFKTKEVNSVFDGAYPVCLKCKSSPVHLEYNSLQLYNQQCFYSMIFDLKKVEKRKLSNVSQDVINGYELLYNVANQALNRNNYSRVDLGLLFCQIFPPKIEKRKTK